MCQYRIDGLYGLGGLATYDLMHLILLATYVF